MVGIHTSSGFVATASLGGAVAMQGATSQFDGKSGSVPVPVAGDNDKFLCGDGNWTSLEESMEFADSTDIENLFK